MHLVLGHEEWLVGDVPYLPEILGQTDPPTRFKNGDYFQSTFARSTSAVSPSEKKFNRKRGAHEELSNESSPSTWNFGSNWPRWSEIASCWSHPCNRLSWPPVIFVTPDILLALSVNVQDSASMMELTVIKRHPQNFQTPSCSEACIYRSKMRQIASPVSNDRWQRK